MTFDPATVGSRFVTYAFENVQIGSHEEVTCRLDGVVAGQLMRPLRLFFHASNSELIVSRLRLGSWDMHVSRAGAPIQIFDGADPKMPDFDVSVEDGRTIMATLRNPTSRPVEVCVGLRALIPAQ